MSAQDHPEPVEPPMTSVPGGIYCLVHGVMDCSEPWCWRCGSHLMDDFGRCADPRCRATCTPEAMAIVEKLKARWRGPVPLEVITVDLGVLLTSVYPSSQPGEPGRGGEPEPSASASGAGSDAERIVRYLNNDR